MIVSGGQNNGNYDGMKSTEILDIEGVEWQKGIIVCIQFCKKLKIRSSRDLLNSCNF